SIVALSPLRLSITAWQRVPAGAPERQARVHQQGRPDTEKPGRVVQVRPERHRLDHSDGGQEPRHAGNDPRLQGQQSGNLEAGCAPVPAAWGELPGGAKSPTGESSRLLRPVSRQDSPDAYALRGVVPGEAIVIAGLIQRDIEVMPGGCRRIRLR